MSIVAGSAFDPNLFQLQDLHSPSHVYVIILWIGYFNYARVEYLRGTWEPGSCKILELVENVKRCAGLPTK